MVGLPCHVCASPPGVPLDLIFHDFQVCQVNCFSFLFFFVSFLFFFLQLDFYLSVLCLVALFVYSFTSTDCGIPVVDMAKWSMGDSFNSFFFFWLVPPLKSDQIKILTMAEPERVSFPAFTPERIGWNGMIL